MSGAGRTADRFVGRATVRCVAGVEVPDRLVGVRRVLAWIVIAQLLVLAVTGAYLVFGYRPTPTQAWGPLVAEQGGLGGRTFAHSVRSAHRWTAWSMLLPGFVLGAVAFGEAMVRWSGPARRRIGVLTGPAVPVFVLVGLISGLVLPWDQLALKAVTVGTDLRGFTWLVGDDVRFVLRDGLELSVDTVRTAFAVHVVLVPVLLALALAAHVGRDRSQPPDPPV